MLLCIEKVGIILKCPMFFRLCCFQNVGDLETIPEDPVEMNGAGHASRKGSTSNEFDVVR